jgi:hypothetical protein
MLGPERTQVKHLIVPNVTVLAYCRYAENTAMDEHSSLFVLSISYEEKKSLQD